MHTTTVFFSLFPLLVQVHRAALLKGLTTLPKFTTKLWLVPCDSLLQIHGATYSTDLATVQPAEWKDTQLHNDLCSFKEQSHLKDLAIVPTI